MFLYAIFAMRDKFQTAITEIHNDNQTYIGIQLHFHRLERDQYPYLP